VFIISHLGFFLQWQDWKCALDAKQIRLLDCFCFYLCRTLKTYCNTLQNSSQWVWFHHRARQSVWVVLSLNPWIAVKNIRYFAKLRTGDKDFQNGKQSLVEMYIG